MMHGMPFVILNMGGEMLYILEQRLQAQKIVEDKSVRVLQDVIGTMFSGKFMDELFKPQKMYSDPSIRQIFDKLAHSSIMRLNPSSMSKLYDLMTMGTKYQVLASAEAHDVAQLTLNHLDALKALIKDASVIALVENAKNKLIETLNKLSIGDMSVLRWTLCRLFQDRRVKVSLFLQEGLQLADGTIVINHEGTQPNGAEKVGRVTYYDMEADDDTKVLKETCFKLNNTTGSNPPKTPAFSMSSPNTNRHCELGKNLYSADRRKNAKGGVAKRGDDSMPLQKGYEAKEEAKEQAKAELNCLADLLGGTDKTTLEKDNFNVVSLFPDTQLIAGGSGDKAAEVITFDAEDEKGYKTTVADLASEFDNLNAGDDDDDDEDDLLSLMDAA